VVADYSCCEAHPHLSARGCTGLKWEWAATLERSQSALRQETHRFAQQGRDMAVGDPIKRTGPWGIWEVPCPRAEAVARVRRAGGCVKLSTTLDQMPLTASGFPQPLQPGCRVWQRTSFIPGMRHIHVSGVAAQNLPPSSNHPASADCPSLPGGEMLGPGFTSAPGISSFPMA